MPGFDDLMTGLSKKLQENMIRAKELNDTVYLSLMDDLTAAMPRGDPMELMGIVGRIMSYKFPDKAEFGV